MSWNVMNSHHAAVWHVWPRKIPPKNCQFPSWQVEVRIPPLDMPAASMLFEKLQHCLQALLIGLLWHFFGFCQIFHFIYLYFGFEIVVEPALKRHELVVWVNCIENSWWMITIYIYSRNVTLCGRQWHQLENSYRKLPCWCLCYSHPAIVRRRTKGLNDIEHLKIAIHQLSSAFINFHQLSMSPFLSQAAETTHSTVDLWLDASMNGFQAPESDCQCFSLPCDCLRFSGPCCPVCVWFCARFLQECSMLSDLSGLQLLLLLFHVFSIKVA